MQKLLLDQEEIFIKRIRQRPTSLTNNLFECFPKSKNIEVGHLPRLPCIFHFFQVCKGLRRMVQPRRIFVSPSMHGRRGFCSWENLPRGRFSQEQKYRGRPSSISSKSAKDYAKTSPATPAYGPTWSVRRSCRTRLRVVVCRLSIHQEKYVQKYLNECSSSLSSSAASKSMSLTSHEWQRR